MRLMIVGGGTGGHITPGIAIANYILDQEKKAQILFVGTKNGLEMDLVPKAGLPIVTIPAAPLVRKISPAILKTCLSSMGGVLKSISLIRNFKPHLILGTGGFVCGPFLIAALILRVPFILQEQNVMPGLTNRLFSSFAYSVALGFKEAAKYFSRKGDKLFYTGNPINQDILSISRLTGAKKLSINPQKKVLLIYGGSRGAKSINRAFVEAYSLLSTIPDLFIMLICGTGNKGEVLQGLDEKGITLQDNLQIHEYCYDISSCLVVADLVVARAGAVGLSEILALGIPSILVPYPYAADNHQYENAKVVADAKAGIIIPDDSLTGPILHQHVASLLKDPLLLKEYSLAAKGLGVSDATQQIGDILLNQWRGEGIG